MSIALTALVSRRMRRAAWALCALLVGGGFLTARPASGDPPKPADATTYVLKRTYKAGDVDRYKLDYVVTMNIPQLGGDTEVVMKMTMKETTKEVKDDGTVITEDVYEEGKVSVAGMEQDITDSLPKLIVTHNKSKLDVKAEGGNDMFVDQMKQMIQSMYEQRDAIMPTKPVKVGDTWKVEMKVPSVGGVEIKMKGDATLVGTEMIGGKKTLKVKYVLDATEEQSNTKMHSETLSNVEIETGKALLTSSTGNGEVMGNKMTSKATITLKSGEDKKPEGDKQASPEKKP